MNPDADSFRALARSSPWRWRTAHVRARSGHWGEVEAWIERPDRMRVLAGGRTHLVADTPGAGVAVGVAWDGVGPRPRVPEIEWRWIGDVEPEWRPDGLVARRPDALGVEAGDIMWQDYSWVAAFDPVELGGGVVVADVRDDEYAGRPVWRAVVVPDGEYDPRCSCCPLLPCLIADRYEFGDDFEPTRAYPDAFDVRLDLATGIAVAVDPLGPLGDDRRWTGHAITILDATGSPPPASVA